MPSLLDLEVNQQSGLLDSIGTVGLGTNNTLLEGINNPLQSIKPGGGGSRYIQHR